MKWLILDEFDVNLFIHAGHNFYVNVYSLLPFYCIHISFVPLHAKFGVTIYRIGQRYRLLNKFIRNYAAAGKSTVSISFRKLLILSI